MLSGTGQFLIPLGGSFVIKAQPHLPKAECARRSPSADLMGCMGESGSPNILG